MKIGIFYGSTNGNTAEAAELIHAQLGGELFDVGKLKTAELLLGFDFLILGTSTWYDGELQDDWDSFLKAVDTLDLTGIKVALFGLGDQEGYGSDFVSGMRIIYDVVTAQGATVIGAWPTQGYSFEDSAAVIDGRFIGLALDQDNQDELTQERIDTWCHELKVTLGV
jgi:flavodoxin long chain